MAETKTNAFSSNIYFNFGNSVPADTEIKVGEGHEETTKFEASWQNWLQTDLEASTKIWEMQQAVEEFGNKEIHTEETKLKLDPLEKALDSLAPKLFSYSEEIERLLRDNPSNKGSCNLGTESAELLVDFNLPSNWSYASHTTNSIIISNGLPNLCVGMFGTIDTYVLHNK